MAGIIRNYFADGNTAKGFKCFYMSNVQGLERLFILKGASFSVKSAFINKIGMDWVVKGYDIEIMHSAADRDSVTGVVIPKCKIGIIDGDQQHDIEIEETGAIEKLIYLDTACNLSQLNLCKGEITKLENKKQEALGAAYHSFSEALKIHDEWEKIYIDNMNFSKAAEITQLLSTALFGDKFAPKKGILKDRFMGGATPEGSIDFISNLTVDMGQRYFIKGRPGTGKSTMLKNLAQNAQQRGFDVEVYHCGFDPDSLDMLIFRELGTVIFDSTAPHEYFPSLPNDKIVDMYKEAVNSGVDEKYDLELKEITQRYKSKISEGTSFLKQAKFFNDEIEKIYNNVIDFEKAEEITSTLNSELLALCQ